MAGMGTEEGNDRPEERSPAADLRPVGHRPVMLEDVVFHVGKDVGVGIRGDAL